MTVEQNKAAIQRFYDELINQENTSVIAELFAPDAIIHDPFMGTHQGADAFRQLLAGFDTAFPHHRVEVHHIIAEGDYVSVLHTHTGRHDGPFLGMPPTGKEVRIGGVEIMRMHNGQIVEFWRHDDDAGILMQLGILAPPAPVTA